jgi:hypothetical protein
MSLSAHRLRQQSRQLPDRRRLEQPAGHPQRFQPRQFVVQASRAFTARFITTCCRRVGSALTAHSSSAPDSSTVMLSGRVRASKPICLARNGRRATGRRSNTACRL